MDLGGPRREFFRLLAIQASERFFIGKEDQKFFCTDVKALQVWNTSVSYTHFQDRDFFALGQYCAASIVQGGNGFPFFHEAVFNYFINATCTGAVIQSEDIPYEVLKYITEKVLCLLHICLQVTLL